MQRKDLQEGVEYAAVFGSFSPTYGPFLGDPWMLTKVTIPSLEPVAATLSEERDWKQHTGIKVRVDHDNGESYTRIIKPRQILGTWAQHEAEKVRQEEREAEQRRQADARKAERARLRQEISLWLPPGTKLPTPLPSEEMFYISIEKLHTLIREAYSMGTVHDIRVD